MKIYDLVIIGAGPAGLFAAKTLLSKDFSILIIEKGLSLDKRKDLVSGWFGKWLFSTNILNDKDITSDVLNTIEKIPIKYKTSKDLAYYLFKQLFNKVDIVFNSTVKKIENNDIFTIETNKKKYFSKKCLISTGSNSVEWLEDICDSLKLKRIEANPKLGVRIEIPTFKINKIIENGYFNITTNNTKSEDININSFVGEWEDLNIVSAFGCNNLNKKSNKTNFMVSFESKKTIKESLKDIKIINVLANDRIKKERVIDFVEGRSILKHMKDFNNLNESFSEFEKIIPMFNSYAIMHIPEIKMNGIIDVDNNMKTNITGLYSAGECTSKANNLIGAISSGLIVGNTIRGGVL